MNNSFSLIDITKACKWLRFSLGYTQQNVADELGYTKENISAFENGRNDSLNIFRWYLDKGFSIDYLKQYMKLNRGGVEHGKD